MCISFRTLVHGSLVLFERTYFLLIWSKPREELLSHPDLVGVTSAFSVLIVDVKLGQMTHFVAFFEIIVFLKPYLLVVKKRADS